MTDQCIDEIERAAADGNVRVLEAVDDKVAVSLHGDCVLIHASTECVECDISNVVVTIGEESSENVDGEYAQPALGFDAHDGHHGLVEDGVARILRWLRVDAATRNATQRQEKRNAKRSAARK